MDEGTIIEWLVGPGDRVERGDVVARVRPGRGHTRGHRRGSGSQVEVGNLRGRHTAAVRTAEARPLVARWYS